MRPAEVRQALDDYPNWPALFGARTCAILNSRANGHTLAQTGRLLARGYGYPLSGNRVRQIENEAVHRLKLIRDTNTPEGFHRHERFGR